MVIDWSWYIIGNWHYLCYLLNIYGFNRNGFLTVSTNKLRLALGVLLAMLAAAVLYAVYRYDPSHTGWMPKCVFRMLTGLDCPSCGSTRALHELLHCNFAAGIRYNPFILVSWPILAVVVLYTVCRPRGIRPRWFWWLIYAYIALYMTWWVVRNIYSL